MSDYTTWDLYSLGHRIIEWRRRIRESHSDQQQRSYLGELRVLEREFNRRFFTGPYFPVGCLKEHE